MANRWVPVAVAVVATVALGMPTFAADAAPDAPWDFSPTNDPALIAMGNSFLDGLPTPDRAHRDPYGTACGAPHAVYCVSSASLSPIELEVAAGERVTQAGGVLERRECDDSFPEMACAAMYSVRGVQVGLTSGTPEDGTGPAHVVGTVVTDLLVEQDAVKPLPSLEELGAVPTGWQTPACAASSGDGCPGYRGPISGTTSVQRAHADVMAVLQRSAFRIDRDRCTKTDAGATKCTILAQKFRTIGGRDGVWVSMGFSSSAAGFAGQLLATADGAPYPEEPAPAAVP